MKKYEQLLPAMLHDGIRVLIYAGDKDYICNWLGNKDWVLQMKWDGHQDMLKAEDTKWVSREGKHAGDLRTSNGLSFLRVFDAGHMVPMNKPKEARYMMEQFVRVAK